MANILIIIVLRHRKMKSSISLIMMGKFLSIHFVSVIDNNSFLSRFGNLWYTLPSFIHFECRNGILVILHSSLLSCHLAYPPNCSYREHLMHSTFMCQKVKKFIKSLCILLKKDQYYLLMPLFLTKLKIKTNLCTWFQTLSGIF